MNANLTEVIEKLTAKRDELLAEINAYPRTVGANPRRSARYRELALVQKQLAQP